MLKYQIQGIDAGTSHSGGSEMGELRVAFAGHDFFSPCLEYLAGRQDVRIVACMVDGPTGQPADNVIRLSGQVGAKMYSGAWSAETIASVNDLDVDLLICAAYKYKIPVERLKLGLAVNIHPTLLPEGRGPDPLPYLVTRRPEAFGLTIHQMTADMDRGPALLQEKIPRSPTDGLNELYLRLLAAIPLAMQRFIDQLDRYRADGKPQQGGSYWPELGVPDRTLKASTGTVAELLSMYREFGMFGVFIRFADGTTISGADISAAPCVHPFQVGTVVAKLQRGWIVALSDGLARVSVLNEASSG